MNICPWRDAGRRLEVFGIPVMMFSLYFAWFQWPETMTLWIVTAIIAFFKVISLFGFTLTVLWQRLFYRLRGQRLSGRPWWYRKFYE